VRRNYVEVCLTAQGDDTVVADTGTSEAIEKGEAAGPTTNPSLLPRGADAAVSANRGRCAADRQEKVGDDAAEVMW